MSDLALAAGAAFWFGILTSISPCLMATNVTAISFIARRVDRPRYVLLSGACYTIGQSIAFVLLAMLLVTSLLSIPLVAHWLQKYMFRLLGPILIVCAMFLFQMFDFQIPSGKLKDWVQRRAGKNSATLGGFWAAALLGVIFAMSFCPTTAALFFGSLIPLATTHASPVFLPLVYALGVALPVIAFSVVIALAANRIGAIFDQVRKFESVGRNATGAVFLLVGLYFTIAYTLELF